MVMASEPVRGLTRFRERLSGLEDYYVLIGGAASILVMGEAELQFRATHDLDIVLCVEALDERFFREFWTFVRDAGYTQREGTSGPRKYYRFQNPTDDEYPKMLELFSRLPDGLDVPEDVHLTPIPSDSDVSSLSAILLEGTYYAWVMDGRRKVDGIQVVGAEYLIPLKARAYLDLSERKQSGEQVDQRSVNKHRSDIVRLATLLTQAPLADEVPEAVREDIRRFVEGFGLSARDMKSITEFSEGPSQLLDTLRIVYGLEE